MKHLRITSWLLLLFVWTVLLKAEHVPVQQARQYAANFLQKTVGTRAAVLPHQLQLVYDGEGSSTRASGEFPAYYVFNNTAGKGFVVVAGDDIISPVLAYSSSHNFDATAMPINLQAWFRRMDIQINIAREQGITACEQVTRQWTRATEGNVVKQLVTAQWDQEEPYWKYCPQYQGQNLYTGCVATALAIVMRYHEWPMRGIGTLPGYTTSTLQLDIPKRPLGHEYQWSLMPLTVKNNISDQQADAIAQFIYDCSVLVKSDFTLEGTGAYTQEAVIPLVEHMDYDKGLHWGIRYMYNTRDWYNLLKREIDQNRPIFYGGGDGQYQVGHAFVLDGYTDRNFFSVNWGWSGMCNGFYQLDALMPEYLGSGSGDYGDYSFDQDALFGFKPNKGTSSPSVIKFLSGEDPNSHRVLHGLSTSASQIQTGQAFLLSFGLAVNLSQHNYEGDIAFAVFNAQGQMKPDSYVTYIGKDGQEHPLIESFTVQDNYGFTESIYGLDESVMIPVAIDPGDVLCMIYRPKGANQWEIVKGNEENDCVWKLPLTSSSVPLDEGTQLSYSKKNAYFIVQTQPDTQLSFLNAQGEELTDRVSALNEGYQVVLRHLPAGTYQLRLTRGQEVYTVDVQLAEHP